MLRNGIDTEAMLRKQLEDARRALTEAFKREEALQVRVAALEVERADLYRRIDGAQARILVATAQIGNLFRT